MDNREIIWHEYKHGCHHSSCNCVACTRRRLGKGNERMSRATAYKIDGFAVSLAKLCLNLALLVALVWLVKFAYDVASYGSVTQAEALERGGIIIGGIAGIVLIAKLSTHGRLGGAQPSLALTTCSVMGMALILGFTGVEPIAYYLQQFGATLDSHIGGWAQLGWSIAFLYALVHPLYALAAIAIIVWIIYTIRHW